MSEIENDGSNLHPKLLVREEAGQELLLPSSILKSAHGNPAIAYLMSLGSKRSRQTMRSFLNIVAKMIGFDDLKHCTWSSLRRHHVLAVLEMLAETDKAPTTINTYLSALKGVALEAWTMKLIDTDSFQHIKQIRSVKGSRLTKGRALKQHEIRSLFDVCENDPSAMGLRDAAILGVLLGCGLRRSEAVALNIEDIIHKERALKVLGKGNKERLAFVPSGSWNRLEQWIHEVRGPHSGALFSRIRRFDDVTTSRLSDQAIYHILEMRRIESRIEKFAPHDLRRTFASAMLDNGEDIVTVKDAMGHSSINTTQKYDRRGDERLRRASERLSITD